MGRSKHGGLKSLNSRFKKFKKKKKQKNNLRQSILFFDMMYLFRSQFSVRTETTGAGVRLGAVVGCINHIQYQIKQYKPRMVFCVFDGEDNAKRRQNLNEDYKADRGQKHKMLASPLTIDEEDSAKSRKFQRNLLIKILQRLPVHTIEVDGLEADDIIGYLCHQYFTGKSKKIIFSADKDFIQLIDDTTFWFNSRQKEMYSLNNYREYFDVPIENIPYVRSILGDSSDGLKGISGVGEKTLFKLLPEIKDTVFENIDDFLQYIESKKVALCETKTGTKLYEGQHIIANTFKIIQLSNPDMSITQENKILEITKSMVYNGLNESYLKKFLAFNEFDDTIQFHKIKSYFKHLRPL